MAFILDHLPQLLQLLLFLIMFGIGMTLTIPDFERVVQYPKAVLVGLFNQVLLLPIIGLAIVSIMALPPVVAMELTIITACLGGATSNLISHLSKGDTALFISLTAFSSLVTVFYNSFYY